MQRKPNSKPLISTKEEVNRLKNVPPERRELSTTHKLAFVDTDFLLREELRPVRLQLELLKPELTLHDHNIHSTIVFFGSARLPEPKVAQKRLKLAEKALEKNPKDPALKKRVANAKRVARNSSYITEAEKLAYIISKAYGTKPGIDFVVATGGGPSFMEAANRGAHLAGSRSIALNIVLPNEQYPNRFVSPELTFQFHYFAIRKMHFFIRAHAMIAFPGGYGTFDELFDALTLMQTNKMQRIPILLFCEDYWRKIINFEAMVDEGTIHADDLKLFQYVETAEQAWKIILDFYNL